MVGDIGLIPALTLTPFSASRVGLVIADDVPYALWEAYGAGIQGISGAMPWILGDWLNYGERIYGETYAQAVESTGMKVQLLMNYKSVARRVPISCRKENLTWTHHEIVSRLDPSEQERWLSQAEAEEWSSKELREALRSEGGAEDPFRAGLRRLVGRLDDLLMLAETDAQHEALMLARSLMLDLLQPCAEPR